MCCSTQHLQLMHTTLNEFQTTMLHQPAAGKATSQAIRSPLNNNGALPQMQLQLAKLLLIRTNKLKLLICIFKISSWHVL